MIASLLRLHLLLARHRLALVVGLAVFAAGALWFGSRLKLSEDFTDMLPLSDPVVAEQFEAMKLFRQANRMFFDVGISTDDPEQLAQAADALHGALQKIPDLGDIRYRLDEVSFQETFRELQAQLPALLTSNDLRAIEQKFEPAALEKRLAWFKKTMSQPQGLMLKDLLRTDPVGLGDALGNRWQALRAGFGEARLRDGRITSADGRHVLLSATPASPASDRKRSANLLRTVQQVRTEVEQHFAHVGLRVSVTGAHRVTLDNATIIQRDALLTSSLAAVCVVAFIWIVYRRIGLALLTLGPPMFGGLAALVVLYLFGDTLSAIVLGCGSILIGITDDYGNHMLYHTEEARHSGPQALGRKAAELVLPLTCSALVTMAAFLMLVISPVAGHRQVGLFAAAGVVFAALFAIVLLPGLIAGGVKEASEPLPLTALVRRMFAWRDRHATQLLGLLLLWTIAAGAGWGRLRFDSDVNHLNGVTAETRREEEAVRAVWEPALGQTVILVTAGSWEEALRKNEAVHAALENLVGQRAIQAYSSIAPLWPSAAIRETRLGAWREFWRDERFVVLSNALCSSAVRMGFRPEIFQPFLASLSAASNSNSVAAGVNPSLSRWAAEYAQQAGDRVVVATLAKVDGLSACQRLREAVRAVEPGALLLNKAALGERIGELARKGLVVFVLLVVAVNALLLMLILGRVELVLVTLLPIVAAIVWTLGTLGLCGVPINVSNCIFVIFIVGVGIDYSLFLVTAKLAPVRGMPDRLAATGGSVTVCAFTTWLGIGLLVLARHPALFSVGLTAMLGMTFSLLATLFLVPTCMDWLLRRKPGSDKGSPTRKAELDHRILRRRVARLYRFQGPYVEQYVYWKLRTDPLFRAVDEATPRMGHILDVGCGYGLVAHWLVISSPQRNVHGVDFDTDKIRVAQATARANARVTFEWRDLLDWPEYPACDCVLLCDMLHYFPHELKATILAKAFRALHPGGRLIVRDAVADKTSKHGRVVLAEKWAVRLGQNRTRHGLHFETKETHLGLLRKSGFARIETKQDAGLGSNTLLVACKNTVD